MAASREVEPGRPAALAAPFGPLALIWLRIGVVLALGVAVGVMLPGYATEATYFWREDVGVFALFAGLVLTLGLVDVRPLTALAGALEWPAGLWLGALALAALIGGWIGVGAVFEHYTLSLDEFLANFDAKIFASGRLLAPLPAAWRADQVHLQPLYMLPVPGFWASSYLPINAALRALASRAGLEDALNPALEAIGVLATWAAGRRLWPDAPRTALVAAILLGTSAQLIVTGMSAYAMPLHLALNMTWLALFLRGGRLGHAGAIATGFFALGIHQVTFHALFAGPFILQLWLDRRWRLAALYTAAYALFCGVWVDWFGLELRLLGLAPHAAGAVGAGWFFGRVKQVVGLISVYNVGPMGFSLVRFVSWQNPLTAPLALLGAGAAFRAKGHVRAMALGVVITLATMLLLQPTQSNGWGYRYLHGFLGTTCLVAAWTWQSVVAALPPARRAYASGAFVALALASLGVFTPLRALQAHAYTHPYAVADRLIRASAADVVLVDGGGPIGFDAGTLVRNDPFLAAGPKVMDFVTLDDDAIDRLCASHRVAVFGGGQAAALGIDVTPLTVDPSLVDMRHELATARCGAPALASAGP